MPIEIEAKMRCADLEAVRGRLSAAGATCVGPVIELNILLDTQDRRLFATDQGLRLRRTRNLRTSDETLMITHKGPRQHGPLKSREETEVQVAGDFEAALHLLEKLGYRPAIGFEKRRETWMLNDCHVELDEVPHLGAFVEIEGASEQSILKVREQLGLAEQPIIKDTYISLLAEFLRDSGPDASAVVAFDPPLWR